MQNNETKTSKPRRRIPFLLRATFAGMAIALTSLWALTVSYDIPKEELLRFFVGSVVMILLVLLVAALLVLLIKLPGMLISRLRDKH
ncbi:MAG: hypothetical protein KKD00_08625 [Gammaproteobacteria bacterium]|nr:hypothetical protein [Gammaproteobacteria bacterium]